MELTCYTRQGYTLLTSFLVDDSDRLTLSTSDYTILPREVSLYTKSLQDSFGWYYTDEYLDKCEWLLFSSNNAIGWSVVKLGLFTKEFKEWK